MGWLKLSRRPVIRLEELLSIRRRNCLPPARAVVITIDDGYSDVFSVAYPILQRYGLPATIFPVTGAIGSVNNWDKAGELAARPMLAWDDLRKMAGANIDCGVHGHGHIRLPEALLPVRHEEMLAAKEQITAHLCKTPTAVAYPYGALDRDCEELAAELGFQPPPCRDTRHRFVASVRPDALARERSAEGAPSTGG
jgi:peptidoglycan/xylan/chitin deacetylase (PgdA/CDA1 family)